MLPARLTSCEPTVALRLAFAGANHRTEAGSERPGGRDPDGRGNRLDGSVAGRLVVLSGCETDWVKSILGRACWA